MNIRSLRKTTAIAASAAILASSFSGCSQRTMDKIVPNAENPLGLGRHVPGGDKVDSGIYMNPDTFGNLSKYVAGSAMETDSDIPVRDIVRILVDEDEPPGELMKSKVEKMEVFGSRLGDVIRLILGDTDVGLIVEPNVDLNLPVNIKIVNDNAFDAIRKTCETAGYHARYDADKASIVIGRYVTHKYFIPAEVLSSRTADVKFGTTEGNSVISPSLNMNSKSPKEILLEMVDSIGSAEKKVSFDEQSGVLIVKERPNFISEIDNAVKDFVKERTEQFSVDLIVAEIDEDRAKNFGLNIYDIKKDGLSIFSLGGAVLNAGSGGIIDAVKEYGGLVISGVENYRNENSVYPTNRSDLAYKMIVDMLNRYSSAHIVQRPNIVLQNHSIGYISVGDENSYVESIVSNTVAGNGGPAVTTRTPVIKKYRDGLQFAVKVDKYRNRDRIGVTIVPIVANSRIVPGPDGIQLLDRKIREAMNVVSIRDGDIILLGGMKVRKGTGEKQGIPGIEDTPIIGDVLGHKSTGTSNVETIFLVRVKRITKAADNAGFSSIGTRNLAESVE